MIYEKEMSQQGGRFKLSTSISLGIGDIREGVTLHRLGCIVWATLNQMCSVACAAINARVTIGN